MARNTDDFADYFYGWFETYREPKIRDVTANKYRMTHKQIEETKLGKMKVKNIRRKDVQEFINNYGKTRRKKTVLDTKRLINASLVDAVHDGLIRTNPCARTEVVSVEDHWDVEKLKEVRETKKWLEFDEYKKLRLYLLGLLNTAFQMEKKITLKFEGGSLEIIESLHKYKHPLQMSLMSIYIAMKTGARIGEILGLTKSDIDLKKKLISINKTWDYKYGGGFVKTKNIASIRDIVVDNEFVTVMKIYYQWLRKHNIKLDRGAILAQEKNNVYISTVNYTLKNIFRSIDIEPITLHKLRHTQASILIAQGVSLQVVAKRLGHTDTNMIQTTYGHLLKSVEETENKKVLELI